jgi:hypothetical protein
MVEEREPQDLTAGVIQDSTARDENFALFVAASCRVSILHTKDASGSTSHQIRLYQLGRAQQVLRDAQRRSCQTMELPLIYDR